MKFPRVLGIALLGSGIASGLVVPKLVGRDLATIRVALENVGTALTNLNTNVVAYTSDSTALEASAERLEATLIAGKTTIDASASLSLTDALALQDQINELTDDAEALFNSLEGKKSEIKRNKQCTTVFKLLDSINTAGQALIDSLIGKVPVTVQGIAELLVANLRDALNDASTSFSAKNCKNGC